MFTRAAARAEILSEIMPYGTDGYPAGDDDEDVPDGWYENDLHLAAELGKTLLERNKDLEASLLATQQQSEEQATQIVYLEKQLHILRDVTESKSYIYEQLDLSSHKLEKENEALKHELKTLQQKNLRMNESMDTLEAQVLDQQASVDQLRTVEKERLREGRRQQRAFDALSLGNDEWGGLPLRRAHSFDLGKPTVESLYEEELSGLQMAIRTLKQELATKEQKEGELESEISVLVRENKELGETNRELQVKSRMIEIKRDYTSLDNLNQAVCRYCDCVMNYNESGEEEEEVEEEKNDIKEDGVTEGQLKNEEEDGITGRLKKKEEEVTKEQLKEKEKEEGVKEGQMKRFSSVDLRPIVEEFNRDSQLTGCPLPDHRIVHSKSTIDGLSLLGEIDSQYHNLMDKYNTLLKRSRSTSFHESSNRPRASSLRRRPESMVMELGLKNASPTKASILESSLSTLSSNKELQSACPIDEHFESGPPEYKQLFKKIYEVLHRPLKKKKPSKEDF